MIILLAVYFTVTPSAISDEVEFSTSPDGKITLWASSEVDLSFLELEDSDYTGGPLVQGEFPEYDIVVKFRNQEGALLHQVSDSYPPVSASWHPESRFVILFGHGYRSYWKHRLYEVGETVKEVEIDSEQLAKILEKDPRHPSEREFDGSVSNPRFPIEDRKWKFAPFAWAVDGLLKVSATELARNPNQPHPFQQQVCNYLVYVDLKNGFKPIKLTATSTKNLSEHKVIWESPEVEGKEDPNEQKENGGSD